MPDTPPPTRKVALVTGGAVRVGRALALGLAEAGYDVAVHYHSSSAAAREVERRITDMGRRATLLEGDLADPAQVAALAHAVRDRCGRLDLLVNSASSFEEADLLDVDAEQWDRVMNVNLRGPFLLVRETAALLRASHGTVINMVDVLGLEPWTAHPHHSVSKAALLHLTKILARVLAPEVRVNAVAPGTVLLPEGSSPELEARERELTPLRRLGSPEDVLRAVLFLAASPFITGEVIVVDGGRRLGP
ncbi:MAG: SDR family oxidoreductase [Gemmatimonadetes bacterium]|nr:SDR family oxidoreductase [Gemmatimonadota bacterium]